LFCSVMATMPAAAQLTIKGRVTAEDTREPLDFVSVAIKGTTKGNITNMEGLYSITAQPADIVMFVYMGYKTVEVVASKLIDSPDIVMSVSSIFLHEIMVKALQEEDILKRSIQRIKQLYPDEPILCKTQIKDVTMENKKIGSYYDFSADLWVRSFDRFKEERNPITMRITNVETSIDRYFDSIPVRPYVMYDKTIRSIIPENYSLRTIMSMFTTNDIKFKTKKDTLAYEEVYVMNFESKTSQNDMRTSASVEKVTGFIVVAVADSSILRIEMEEVFDNYTNISHFYKGIDRIQCTVTFDKQSLVTSFRRVKDKIYPEYAKTLIYSTVKFADQTLSRQQMSLILINDIITDNVKRIPKKEAYDKSMPLYHQISAENDSWRTINSLPLTQEEKAFINANR
jgi:hypothetical protein